MFSVGYVINWLSGKISSAIKRACKILTGYHITGSITSVIWLSSVQLYVFYQPSSDSNAYGEITITHALKNLTAACGFLIHIKPSCLEQPTNLELGVCPAVWFIKKTTTAVAEMPIFTCSIFIPDYHVFPSAIF
jgi:hypothetical protein